MIHGVKRKLKQRMFSKGECDNCGFKQTMLCPKCKVCTQCCGCNNEIAEVEDAETRKRGMHATLRCMDVLDSTTEHSKWLYLIVEARVGKWARMNSTQKTNNGVNERNMSATAEHTKDVRTPGEAMARVTTT